jgi:glutamate-1-semialdehyde aminotransferase
MEPMRYDAPRDGFLDKVRALADETGAVLIFDEVTSGWRSHHGGIHLKLGVAPDLAVFAKSLSNGFPMAAVIGRGRVMEAAQRTFVSSTYWTEGIGPAAALATLRRLKELDAVAHIAKIGDLTRQGWRDAAARHGLQVTVGGIPALCNFSFSYGDDSRRLMTLFTQTMLDRGYLANGVFYPTCAHTPAHVEAYLQTVGEVFGFLKSVLDEGSLAQHLRGPVAHSGFARLT